MCCDIDQLIEEDMFTNFKCLYIVLLITLTTLMVVLATNAPAPVGKNFLSGATTRTSLQILENSNPSTQEKSPTIRWSKKFLDKHEATPHSAPFIVSIQLMTPENGLVHYCAGTIINENWILTAAHCLTSDETVKNSVIVAGCHDIHSENEADSVQIRPIESYVQHELFLGGVNPYDIALIYLKRPLTLNKYVQVAHLPEADILPDGYGTLFGWGNVSMTYVPKFPHKLQEANMPILDMELCEQILATSGLSLHETNLCTGPLTGGVSICTADSGGPLMQTCCDYFGDSFTVIGIVSWGKMPCGQKNAPSVFVRVSAFTNWITDIITKAIKQQ